MTPSEVRAILSRANGHADNSDWDLASSLCRELAAEPLAEADASELVVVLAKFPDAKPDAARVESAGLVLIGANRLELAITAFMIAGRLSGTDLSRARKNYAFAVGCSEVAGALVAGPRALLDLASVEVQVGKAEDAARLCDNALRRLDGVQLRSAQAEQARALELLGDIRAARGERDAAVELWTKSHDAFVLLEHRAARRLAEKLKRFTGQRGPAS